MLWFARAFSYCGALNIVLGTIRERSRFRELKPDVVWGGLQNLMGSFHCIVYVISEGQVRNAPNSILLMEYQSIKKSLLATNQQCEEIFCSIVLCLHIPISSQSSTFLLHYVPFSYSHHLFSAHLHSTCHLTLHAASLVLCLWFLPWSFFFYFCFLYALRREKLLLPGCGLAWILSW